MKLSSSVEILSKELTQAQQRCDFWGLNVPGRQLLVFWNNGLYLAGGIERRGLMQDVGWAKSLKGRWLLRSRCS